mgnify:CR=1 FL=1
MVELDPDATTERHLAEVERSMRAMMPERMHSEIRRHLDLARNSPGMHEAAMLEAGNALPGVAQGQAARRICPGCVRLRRICLYLVCLSSPPS